MVERAFKGQCLALAHLFRQAGHTVITSSSSRNRYMRLLQMIWTLLRFRKTIDVVVMDIYSGRRFVVEDILSRIAGFLGLPIVLVLRGGDMPNFAKSHRSWVRGVLSRTCHLIAPSSYMEEAFRSEGFLPVVIPNVIDLKHYQFRERSHIQPRLLWMRTFHPAYNPELAIKVLKAIKKNFPTATLVMAGAHNEHQKFVRNLATLEGLGSSVQFPGFLSLEEKLKVASGCDIFIHTNRIDNMPVSILEACGLGLPCVCTNVGGIPHLIQNNVNGIIVQENNVEAMQSAIERLLIDARLTQDISRNARQLAEKSDWTKVHPQWIRVFEAAA